MRLTASLLRPLAGILLIAGLALSQAGMNGAAAAPAQAVSAEVKPGVWQDRVFESSRTLSLEIRYLMVALETNHYNRSAVTEDSYKQVIPDFMGDLDAQHLFFLAGDKQGFSAKYEKNLYWNAKIGGNIASAYDIFNVYAKRATARINWVFQQLDKDIDLTTDETYLIDRSKAEWPATEAEADELWRRRLKSEMLLELLGQKKPTVTDSTAPGTTPKAVETPKLSPVDEAKDVLRKRYRSVQRNIASMEASDVAEVFLTSISALFDPHSNYFSPDSLEDFGITMKLTLFGIGAVLESKDDYCIVKEIVPGAPADLSNQIHPEDKILSVAQVPEDRTLALSRLDPTPVDIFGMRLRNIVKMIRGDSGTKVRLTVQPSGTTDASARKEVVLTRDKVMLNNARAHAAVFEVPGENGATVPLGVITLPTFYGDSGDETGERVSVTSDVAELLKRLEAAGVKGVVLDLRFNGGGLLSEAIDLTGLFIPKGPVVQVKDSLGRIMVDSDEDPGLVYTGPLAVLTNRFSASASEIVAGALQNYGRALIIGDSSTHGKGTVQTIQELRGPTIANAEKTGAIKYTIQKFYLPNGSSTQLRGVVPDIVLPSIDDYIPNIGEASLPHALVWDDIRSARFDGKALDPGVIQPLLDASRSRQAKLEEFSFLNRNIEWLKGIQNRKTISLNLSARQKQKESEDAFRKTMKDERDRLAKNDFPYKEVRLVPAPPPRIKAVPVEGDEDSDDSDSTDAYAKVDILLRESLRVVEDYYMTSQPRSAPATGSAGSAPDTTAKAGRG